MFSLIIKLFIPKCLFVAVVMMNVFLYVLMMNVFRRVTFLSISRIRRFCGLICGIGSFALAELWRQICGIRPLLSIRRSCGVWRILIAQCCGIEQHWMWKEQAFSHSPSMALALNESFTHQFAQPPVYAVHRGPHCQRQCLEAR